MTRSGRSWVEIRVLARDLLCRADADKPGLLQQLRTDADAAIRARADVIVHEQQLGTVVTGCLLGGAYVRHSPPALPKIVLSRSGNVRRDRFSLCHEFCHHLIDADTELADLLFAEPDRGHALEEDICNSAAAYLLVRGADVDLALGDHSGVSAHAIRTLYDLSQGSLEVCCVALSDRMAEPGHILICDPDAEDPSTVSVRFTARGPEASRRPAAELQRSSLFAVALEQGAAYGAIAVQADDRTIVERHADVLLVNGAFICVLAPVGRSLVACC